MKLSKIDLSNVLAVGHSNGQLGLLIDRGECLEFIEIAAPEAAMHGLHMVDFIANTDSTELSGGIELTEIAPADEPIAMMPVDSAMASAIGYNEEAQVLQIEFSSGSVYQYSDVESEIWESLQEADSTGRFFNSEIKGYYSSRCVDDSL
ncbi:MULTISPECIES: KTSC domain-containing protein [unclassified Microcoleus]|uniref:KTSC domain-containing protein n=1 Tax=unclassified Microcoleus TaxID=2642155 RepID=UPI001D759649|nr:MULTISPECIES: KTSC domain-containing protein [unclassified Microcoleus]MCC3565318.1 KTSC domain-containing protein [Microcoleus sp. PH2017_31_RDM_U_A]MCC3579752.1 KTSC domain-containing protein [Microcoleus sp. PH2017_32_RDM_D_A]MCC3617842.1 KTSC domain-containing protein [Microcoleus sp. PH2017_38_RDM_U_B]